MNVPCVLLLDFAPAVDLSCGLKGILESAGDPCVELRHEVADHGNLAGPIIRCDPSVVFLLLDQVFLKRAPEMLARLKLVSQERPVVVVADRGEPAEMFQLLERGATDFFTSPLRASDILPRLWRLLSEFSCRVANPDSSSGKQEALRSLVGRNAEFLCQLQRIPMVAKCDASVLIAGETGTGKELFAKAIHQMSPRANRAFTPVNCGAIPVDLVENELFGHDRGAFTGANISRPGLIQETSGGTLFLDEIDSLPLLAQVKLLRFLQEKEYRALGSTKAHYADVRVITATNLNIEEAVRSGRLRKDLYYRLNIIALTLPPLRQRPDDIPVLADYFLKKFAAKFGKRFTGFSPGARRKFALHDWPGNVRELEHMVERAAALSEHPVIEESDIVLPGGDQDSGLQPFQEAKASVVTQFERTYLQSLMLACSGNITQAAQLAQKDRRALFELLRKHHIDASSFRFRASGPVQNQFALSGK
jgi:two-component system, NtrC family, response regulator GlrR